MLLDSLLANILFLALHFETAGAFPPPLKPDVERKLLKEMKNGSNEAKEELIKHNLRLVTHIMKKYYVNENENEELISIGTIGLIKAINSFNMDKGVRLATYASRCIENEILMYFRNKKKSVLDISLDEPIETDSEGNPLTLMDIIAVEDTAVEDFERKNNIIKLKKFVSEIKNEREKRIITMRYGLDGLDPLTQNEIAEIYGISRSYVSRLETKIIKNLRKKFDNSR
ncbi:MAG: sigma-70 family RNA polymerase sigma factor [Ruminococcaceae bacterium]|nr:sigma-70 family RNA polymerase sigma factor [Oscillospiraceae bacterium]